MMLSTISPMLLSIFSNTITTIGIIIDNKYIIIFTAKLISSFEKYKCINSIAIP